GFDSALAVTSDYHVKRSKYIFEKLNEDRFELRYISSLSIDGERWYEEHGAACIRRSELTKLWGYRFGLYWWSGLWYFKMHQPQLMNVYQEFSDRFYVIEHI